MSGKPIEFEVERIEPDMQTMWRVRVKGKFELGQAEALAESLTKRFGDGAAIPQAQPPINIFLDGGDDPSLFTLENFFHEHGSGVRITDKDCGAAVELAFRDYETAMTFRDRVNAIAVAMIPDEDA
jgi:hypothetical protein